MLSPFGGGSDFRLRGSAEALCLVTLPARYDINAQVHLTWRAWILGGLRIFCCYHEAFMHDVDGVSLNVQPPAKDDSGASNLAPIARDVGMELRLFASRGAFERVRELPVIIQHARNRGDGRHAPIVELTR